MYGVSTVICAFLLIVTWAHTSSSSNAPAAWNTADVNAASNGNIPLAVQWLQVAPQTIRSSAVAPQPSTVFKTPPEYYGQVVKLTGKVTSVQEQSRGARAAKELGGTASEITVLAKDGTHIEFLMAGNSKQIKPGDTVSVYGYPVGYENISNKSGGTTTELVVVGNAYDDPAH